MDVKLFGDPTYTNMTLDEIQAREDMENYYVNPRLREINERIFVPCGFGNTDNGFFIYGIKKENNFEDRSINVFSVVYNYLLRNSQMTDADIPTFLKQKRTVHEIEYRSVFRLAIILLQMVKNGYLRNGVLTITYDEDLENLQLAVEMINDYAERFSRLAHSTVSKIRINLSGNGLIISLRHEVGIYAKDNHEFVNNARELWYGRKINYFLTKNDLPELEYFLREVSPFDHFREGQYEAICNMLETQGHSVCIMPTGCGKSLVYYMLSILQPLPLYVIAPTDILIQDQIRNLKETHHIDDIAHLQLASERSFLNFEAHNKLIYMTPMTLQNRDLLAAFRYINNGTRLEGYREVRIAPGTLAAYIVLDEIHCLSNWGHDFRPEYLMLSKFLNRHLNNVKFRGFTATANYTVVKDVQHQLSIPEDAFFSPIAFEKYNVSYHYICCKDFLAMSNKLSEIAKTVMGQNERTIIFTKSDAISKKLARMIGYGADVFSAENPKSYYSFAAGKSKLLIATEDLGIGINFPNVRNVIHFGLPISKNEYIQEIGRAGRANEHVTSYVLYLEENTGNVPLHLLKRSTKIEAIPEMLSTFDNDFADIYRKLTNNCPTKADMVERLVKFYKTFDYQDKASEVRSFGDSELESGKQLLYMLFCCGYVSDWYFFCASENRRGMDIVIDICSKNAQEYRNNPLKMLNRMKEKSVEYYNSTEEENQESTTKVNWAETPEEILAIYVDWYYLKYLYHHNEQFLDLYEFITTSKVTDKDSITDNIKDYFKLPFAQLRDDEVYFNSLSTEEIVEKAITGIGRDTVINIERIISDRYSYKLDLLLFFGHLIKNGVLEKDRMDRILKFLPEGEKAVISKSIASAYDVSDLNGRIQILNFIESDGYRYCLDYDSFFNAAYRGKAKDLIYYARAFEAFNEKFRRFAT